MNNSILTNFSIPGELLSCDVYGNGLINSTLCAVYNENGSQKKYIVQEINSNIFKDVEGLMNNISYVTDHIRAKTVNSEFGSRSTMEIVKTRDDKLYYHDGEKYYRVYKFVEDTITFQQVENKEQFESLGAAFGEFYNQLSDFDATKLVESIKDFHNTKVRFAALEEAIANDAKGRLKDIKDEVAFALERKEKASFFTDMIEKGEITLRVTHNDTKLNNVLFDAKTKKAMCVIDLDTIMPGLCAYDFGDSIRFGASTAAEDEQDLSKVHFSIELFESYSKGFLNACGKSLTDVETDTLPQGAWMMTFECGIRFLTDYLNGDTYFKTKYDTHNLVRCRTQFKLVKEMEESMDAMNAVVKKYK